MPKQKKAKKLPHKKQTGNQYPLLSESYISLALGAIAVVIATLFFLSFIHRAPQITVQTPDQPQAMKTDNKQALHVYVVQSGDSLWTIAEQKYQDGYQWVVIAKANNLASPGTIYQGDTLTIPSLDKAVAGLQTQTQPASDTLSKNADKIDGSTYTVVAGDDLWSISVRAYGDGYQWTKIAQANHLANPDTIHNGNVLQIPR